MNIREGILLGSFLVAGFLNPANATPVPVTFFTYTLENGVYEPSGIPITGTITVAAPSDTVTSADLITNLGTFSIILGQQIDGSGYDLSLENTAGTFEINQNLSSASSLFSGVGTTINTDLSDIVPIPGRAIGVPSGTFAISAVPEPSTWAMMVFELPRRRLHGISP
jgi:hypothetical protein